MTDFHESHNTEFKSSWHDDYLKWICGFANAMGGIIYIGKADNGQVIGLADYTKLMKDLPNKIRNAMGIICDVQLHEEDRKKFISITVNPYSVPVSLRGRFYYRSNTAKMSGKTSGKIIDAVRSNPYITIPELAALIGITTRSIERSIGLLKKSKQLKRVGSAKDGYWEVTIHEYPLH